MEPCVVAILFCILSGIHGTVLQRYYRRHVDTMAQEAPMSHLQRNQISRIYCLAACETHSTPPCKGVNFFSEYCNLVLYIGEEPKMTVVQKVEFWVEKSDPESPVPAECPEGFDHRFEKSNNHSCYQINVGRGLRMEFLDASNFCLKLKSRLVSIETEEEQNHLEDIIERNPSLQPPDGLLKDSQYYYWTNGAWIVKTREWEWLNTTHLIKNMFSKWKDGKEPSFPDSMWHPRLVLSATEGLWWTNKNVRNHNWQGLICEIKVE